MSDDLVEWLRAQLDEDERVAQAAGEADNGGPVWREGSTWFQDMLDPLPSQRRARPNYIPMITEDDVRHIANWDPARVLREVEAKRKILDLHDPRRSEYEDLNDCPVCISDQSRYPELWVSDDAPCATVRLLAAPYSDRPGYREEWRLT